MLYYRDIAVDGRLLQLVLIHCQQLSLCACTIESNEIRHAVNLLNGSDAILKMESFSLKFIDIGGDMLQSSSNNVDMEAWKELFSFVILNSPNLRFIELCHCMDSIVAIREICNIFQNILSMRKNETVLRIILRGFDAGDLEPLKNLSSYVEEHGVHAIVEVGGLKR